VQEGRHLLTEAGGPHPEGAGHSPSLPLHRTGRLDRVRTSAGAPRINKSFGAVHVLHDVDLRIFPGQVTALVGDNGAGKSTLVKAVAGIHSIDSGQYLFDGAEQHVHGPKDAAALGIEIVYQDLALCDNLDIVQNMFPRS
jgi:ABC-type sugar transport system ATPase subunit